MIEICIGITILAFASAVYANNNPTPHKSITYKTIDDVELQLHIFDPEGHSAGDKRPAIVFFFGGGWNGGNPKQFYPHCAYLASRGMVAISAEYRVKTRHDTPPSECVKDGKSAIRWIRNHAGELGIDPNMLAAGGGSAGGHVAAATGTLDGFNEEGENLSTSCIPGALVLFNPVYDTSEEGYGYERVKDYWREFSPMHNLSENTPPTIVFLGTEDNLIPVATAENHKEIMNSNGVRSDLHLYEGQAHGFFNFKNQEYYIKTVIEADKFLALLGYLQGEPTIKE